MTSKADSNQKFIKDEFIEIDDNPRNEGIQEDCINLKCLVDHPENNLVSKHNKMIYARYKLTLLQQRFILLLISHIQPSDDDFKIYEYDIKEITRGMGLKESNSNHTLIKNLTEELMDGPALRIIEITPHTKKEIKTLVHWFNIVKYIGNSRIRMQFSSELKPYLLNLQEHYTPYRLINVMKLKSTYHIRIYELLKANEWKSSKTVSFGFEELKDMLGVEEGKYKNFGHFNDRVLSKAQLELKAFTDIKFDYEPIKMGRKVSGVKFYIQPNKNYCQEYQIDSTLEITTDLSLISKSEQTDRAALIIAEIMKYDVSRKMAEEFVNTHSEEYILENIEIVKYMMLEGKIKTNTARALVDALRKDYRIKNTHISLPCGTPCTDINNEKKIKKQVERDVISGLRNQYEDFKIKEEIKYYENLKNNYPELMDTYIDKFVEWLVEEGKISGEVTRKIYSKENILDESFFVHKEFRQELPKLRGDILPIVDFTDFAKMRDIHIQIVDGEYRLID